MMRQIFCIFILLFTLTLSCDEDTDTASGGDGDKDGKKSGGDSNADIGCLEKIMQCFTPSGEIDCTIQLEMSKGSTVTEMVWESGHRHTMEMNMTGGSVVQKAYESDGTTICYTMTMSGTPSSDSATLHYEGSGEEVDITIEENKATIHCDDGDYVVEESDVPDEGDYDNSDDSEVQCEYVGEGFCKNDGDCNGQKCCEFDMGGSVMKICMPQCPEY